jgi:hypothetical protein
MSARRVFAFRLSEPERALLDAAALADAEARGWRAAESGEFLRRLVREKAADLLGAKETERLLTGWTPATGDPGRITNQVRNTRVRRLVESWFDGHVTPVGEPLVIEGLAAHREAVAEARAKGDGS